MPKGIGYGNSKGKMGKKKMGKGGSSSSRKGSSKSNWAKHQRPRK